MTKAEGASPRVVRVERPSRRYTLLRDLNGAYLGCADGELLASFDHVDDKAIWERTDRPGSYRHVTTGVSVDVRRAAPGPGWRAHGPGEARVDVFAPARGPDELPSAYLRAFVDQGWVCLPAMIDSDTVAALQSVAGVGGEPPGSQNDHAEPLDRDVATVRAATEPVSLWLARQYLRTDEVRLAHAPSLAVLERDDEHRDVQGWHSDFPYLWGSPRQVGGDRVPTGTSSGLALGVQRNICITVFTRANGATVFKLGSHLLDTGPPRAWGIDGDYCEPGHRQRHGLPYEGPEADVIEAPPGSIILYDARTWHRAGVNRTDQPRAALLQAVTPMYIMPFKDTTAPYKALMASAVSRSLTGRERRELDNLFLHRIVGPLGRHVITADEDFDDVAGGGRGHG